MTAAHWLFDGAGQERWHFSLAAICGRRDLNARKMREAIRARLTPLQRAWIAALEIRNDGRVVKDCAVNTPKGGSVSGRS